MTILILTLLAVSLLAFMLTGPIDSSGARPLISARNLLACLFIVYYLFPGILVLTNAGRFTWAPAYSSNSLLDQALLTALAGFLALGAGAALSSVTRMRRESVPRSTTAEVVGHTAQRLALGLVIVGIAMKIYVIQSTGGLTDTLLRLSGTAREVSGVADLPAFAVTIRSASSIAEIGAVWLCVEAMRGRFKASVAATAMAVVLVLAFASSGKRLTLLLPLLALAVAYHRYRRRIAIKHAPLLLASMFGLGMATILFRVFIPANAAGINVRVADANYGSGSLFDFYAYSLEFSTVDMTAVAIHSGDNVRGMFGGGVQAFYTTSLEPFLYGIPRVLFPSKPEAFFDVSHGISASLRGTTYRASEVGYASTAVGTNYVLGGIVGVVIGLFVLGVIADRVDRIDVGRTWTTERVISYGLALNLIFHLFRQGTLGWTFIIGVVQQYGYIVGFLVLVLVARHERSRSTVQVEGRRVETLK